MIARLIVPAVLLMSDMAPATADPPRCFSITEMNGWRSADGKSIYLRIGVGRFYRIDLAHQCSTLTSINPHLVLQSRGSGQICSALDLDIKASNSPAGILEPCIPKSLTALSPAEVAALPRDVKP